MRDNLIRAYRIFFLAWIVLLFFLFALLSTLFAFAQANLPEIVKKIAPSVVVILTYDNEGKAIAQGSGFFINNEGHIITNYHVLQQAAQAKVKTFDGKIYSVKEVLSDDKKSDLVYISVDIPRNAVRPLTISISLPEVGESIFVIGSPLGLEQTVSDGIVSAVRNHPGYGEVVQITAPISPGSSGSPVVNMSGKVIGVATFLKVGGQNLNFSIPGKRVAKLQPGTGINLVKWAAKEKDKVSNPAEEAYLKGIALANADEYEKALPYFLDAAKKDPRYYLAYSMIGMCNQKLGRLQEAIEAYIQSIRLKPDDIEFTSAIYLNLGNAYYKLKKYDQAIEAYKESIHLNSEEYSVHLNMAVVYRRLGKVDQAMKAYREVVRLKPDLAAGHEGLGYCYFLYGRDKEAINALKEALHIKPGIVDAHLLLGYIYFEGLNDKESAMREYNFLKELDPQKAEALLTEIQKR